MSVDSEKEEERPKNGFVDEEAGEDDDDIDDLEALWEEDARSEGEPENTEAAEDDGDGMPMNIDDDSNNAISNAFIALIRLVGEPVGKNQ